MVSFFNAMWTFGKTGYYLVKSADIIFSMNRYLVLSFVIFGSYKIFKNFIWNPFREVSKFLIIESRPLSSLLYTYGKNLIIITGPTTGLGPAYCRKLIEAGYRDFLLIDEDMSELEKLKSDLTDYYNDIIVKQQQSYAQKRKITAVIDKLNLDIFYFDFDDSYEPERFKPLE